MKNFAGAISCILLSIMIVSCKHDSAQQSGVARATTAEENEAQRLLPSAADLDGWQPEGKSRTYSGEALFEHIDGGADIYFEYGFVTLVTQHYAKADTTLSLEIYCMKDAPAAFGIYSYNRHPSLSPVEIGDKGVIHPNGLYFWKAKYYVDIRQAGPATVANEDFVALAKAIEKKIGTTAAPLGSTPPEVMESLPAKDMVSRSEVFARGKLGINNQVYVAEEDLFGLSDGDAAAIGRYKIGRTECSLIVAEYSGEEACRKAFNRFREHFLGSQSTKENEFIATAMPAKYHGVRKIGKRLVVVANADSPEHAIDMLGRIAP
ncbi:hypothetical protein HZA56_00350 [Candidatus Poribacteria bacterium]|nr:hypothetical protein [Candidatus Poribacteria bacterium]